jgi:hypothetical protein
MPRTHDPRNQAAADLRFRPRGHWDRRGQQSRCPFLPDDGDRLQSPKRRVSFTKDIRWIMSRKFVTLL